ncbi:hypothetical protein I4U23_005642 [Adineta vaga]|nr:hypothetical protein I4U23_005642 [Adineta vaga]
MVHQSATNDKKGHSSSTATFVIRAVVLYVLYFIFPPFVWICYLFKCIYKCCKCKCCDCSNLLKYCTKRYCIKGCWTKKCCDKTGQLIFMEFLTFICYGCFLVTGMNWIFYYKYSLPSFEVNELEIYEPLAWVISTMTVLHIYKVYNYSLNKRYKSADNHVDNSEVNTGGNLADKNDQFTSVANARQQDSMEESGTQNSLKKRKTPKIFSECERGCYVYYTIWIIPVGIGILHAFIPTIDRYFTENEGINHTQWEIRCMRISYIIFSCIFDSVLFIMIFASITHYTFAYNDLKNILSPKNIKANNNSETSDISNMCTPEYLKKLLSTVKEFRSDIDPYHIYEATMGCALSMNLLLIGTVAVYAIIYGYPFDLLIFWCCIDIATLSIFIVIFLGVVVFINELLLDDFISKLRKLKLEKIDSMKKQDNNKELNETRLPMERENSEENIDYLSAVIEHMESKRTEYAIKLLGFIVDKAFIIKILASIGSSIVSVVVACAKTKYRSRSSSSSQSKLMITPSFYKSHFE